MTSYGSSLLTAEQVRNMVGCPKCKADRGVECKNVPGNHSDRVRAARAARVRRKAVKR